jgi:hypothetical protein
MLSLHADSVAELEQRLAPFGNNYLFRGQVKEYTAPDGTPILNSSFVRMGCVPPLMLKWIFYVDELLRRGGFNVKRPQGEHFDQGLLQHYGWRSFFVDLSASKAVGAWFASHVFKSSPRLNFCENSFEEPVMLRVQRASYTDHADVGNLYVLSKDALKKSGHTLISLVDDLTAECPTRYGAQQAWLASIFLRQRRLEPAAIAAHITAPAEVFREMAAKAGFKETEDLFPGPDKDQILQQLLSLPRMKLEVADAPFPFYQRSLEIPEYQDSFEKHLPPSTVLASRLWLSDIVERADAGLWVRVEEDTFYGHTDHDVPMPKVFAILRERPTTHIETDGLICFPVTKDSRTFDKGLLVHALPEGRFEISSLTVDYSSDRLTAVGASRGYTYTVQGDRFVRSPSEGDCPCGDPEKHRLHLQAMAVLEDRLGHATIMRNGHIVTVSN